MVLQLIRYVAPKQIFVEYDFGTRSVTFHNQLLLQMVNSKLLEQSTRLIAQGVFKKYDMPAQYCQTKVSVSLTEFNATPVSFYMIRDLTNLISEISVSRLHKSDALRISPLPLLLPRHFSFSLLSVPFCLVLNWH